MFSWVYRNQPVSPPLCASVCQSVAVRVSVCVEDASNFVSRIPPNFVSIVLKIYTFNIAKHHFEVLTSPGSEVSQLELRFFF